MWRLTQNRQVIFGDGAAGETGAILHQRGFRRVFAFASPRLHGSELLTSLRQAGVEVILHDEVRREPDLALVDGAAAHLAAARCDAVLAIGGGSVLDAAKAAAMLAANGGKIEDYQMNGRPINQPALPVIALPTTAGTGSEATQVSVIYNPHNRLKKSVYSPLMIPDTVILDPRLTLTLPAAVTAATGIDALSHAIESYVSLNAHPASEMFSLAALQMIAAGLVQAIAYPDDTAARGQLLLGSYYAGCALTAGIGLAHMIAQPLGGLLHLPHGDACSIFLPIAMAYNLAACPAKYARLAVVLGAPADAAPEESIARVRQLIRSAGAPSSLEHWLPADFSLDETVSIIQGATGHIRCNPKPVDAAAIRAAVAAAMPA